VSANWEGIFDWLEPKLEHAGVSSSRKDIQVIAELVQDREAEAARQIEEYEEALKQIRDTPHERQKGPAPCATCWNLKGKANQVLSRWE